MKISRYSVFFVLLTFLFLGCGDDASHDVKSALKVRSLQKSLPIPTNAILYLEFSEPLQRAYIADDMVQLIYKDTEVDIDIEVQGTRLTVQPTMLLTPDANYTMMIQGIVSESGLELLEPFEWRFQTTQHSDTKAPQLLATLPRFQSNSIAVDSEVALQFDEIIDDTNITTNTLQLFESGTQNTIAATLMYEHDIIRLSPQEDLQEGKSYELHLNGDIKDLYGNSYKGETQWEFTVSLTQSDENLSEKIVDWVQLSSKLQTLHVINNRLFLGDENGILNIVVDTNTCTLGQELRYELNATVYALADSDNERLILGAENGVYLFEYDFESQPITWNLKHYLATEHPVYDLALREHNLYVAQTVGGLALADINNLQSETPMASILDATVSDVALSENGAVAVDNMAHEYFVIKEDNTTRHSVNSGIYALYSKGATFEAAMGINGFGNVDTTGITTLYEARSFVSNVTYVEYNEGNYTLFGDKNRGVVLADNRGGFRHISDRHEGLFDIAYVNECVVLVYDDGLLRSVDVLEPYLVESDLTFQSVSDTIFLQFNEDLDAKLVTDETLILLDDQNQSVAINSEQNGSRITIQPQQPLFNHMNLKLHVGLFADRFSNKMKTKYVLDVKTEYSNNSAPIAQNDTVTLNKNTKITYNVLSNDYDYDGNATLDETSVVITDMPDHGSASVDHGFVTYIPVADYVGADSLKYTVMDDKGSVSNIATLFITVVDVNNAPIANDDSAIYASQSLSIDVVANDTDSDGTIDPTTVTITKNPLYGTVSVNATTGVVEYNSSSLSSGASDTFNYTVRDDDGAVSAEATVTVTSI